MSEIPKSKAIIRTADHDIYRAIRKDRKRINPFSTFCDRLEPANKLGSLFDLIKSTVRIGEFEVSENTFERFLKQSYLIMVEMVAVQNQLEIARHSKKMFTAARVHFYNGTANLRTSLLYLQQAEDSIQDERKDYPRNDFDFATPRKALKRLLAIMEKKEAFMAYAIHPKLRSPKAEEALSKAPKKIAKRLGKIWNLDYPVTPKSSAPEHVAIDKLAEEIATFTNGKASAQATNRMIAGVFSAAVGTSLDPETIKKIRARRKQNL